jgi:hypothetical protein
MPSARTTIPSADGLSAEVVLLFDPAFHSKLSQDSHHTNNGNPGQLRRPAERSYACFVALTASKIRPRATIARTALDRSFLEYCHVSGLV